MVVIPELSNILCVIDLKDQGANGQKTTQNLYCDEVELLTTPFCLSTAVLVLAHVTYFDVLQAQA